MPKRMLKQPSATLSKTKEGAYRIVPPEIHGLVLSGGGAKGIAYAGMLQTLEEQGVRGKLTHVSGASAGAMTASLIAMGISAENIKKIVTQLNIMNLLDREGVMRIRARGNRFCNVLDLIYLYRIKELMDGVERPASEEGANDYNRLKRKIALCETALNGSGVAEIENLDQIIGLTVADLQKVDAAFATLPKEIPSAAGSPSQSPRIAFGDLARLRHILPPEKQGLILDLSVVTTNQTTKGLEVYNGESGEGASIAEQVQLSGAHPLIFSPGRDRYGQSIGDGGILNNMPSEPLTNLGLNEEEILCVTLTEERLLSIQKRASRSPAPLVLYPSAKVGDLIAEPVIGGAMHKGGALTQENLKRFSSQGNLLQLSSGTITTTTLRPTDKQKEEAISIARKQTQEFLEQRTPVYSNPLMAMLSLGKKELERLITDGEETGREIDKELLPSAAQAQMVFLLQESLARKIKRGAEDSVEGTISKIQEIFEGSDAQLSGKEQQQAMILCLQQVNFLSEGGLERYLSKKPLSSLFSTTTAEGAGPKPLSARQIHGLFRLELTATSSVAKIEKTEQREAEHIAGKPVVDSTKKKPDEPDGDSGDPSILRS